MPCDYQQLTHPGVQHLFPYIPGKSIQEVRQQHGITDIIKLGSNENALGCSPHVMTALHALSMDSVMQYPVYAHHPFLHELSEFLGIDVQHLTLANGSDALFGLLMICFAIGQDKHIITHDYAFRKYIIQAHTYGIPIVNTPMRDWQVDIDAMITTCNEKTALIFIANPNNPTGGWIPTAEIKRLLGHIPETTLLVLDEAYIEFLPSHQETLSLLKHYPNLVITRTFSKAYGLAGLRLGYAIAHPQITALMKKIHLPFAVNIAALTAGSAALKDQTFVDRTRQTILQNRNGLAQQLQKHGVAYLATYANFITLNCEQDCLGIVLNLEKMGIIVRPLHPYGMKNYMRVTIGTQEQNQRFLNALLHIINEPSLQGAFHPNRHP